jgi:cytochrome c oxidase subunit II
VRRGSLAQLIVIGLVAAAATTAVAVFVPWLPTSASRERDRIDLVFWVATGICVGVFSVVASVIVYSVWKFRARPDDDSDGAPIHGHTGLEIAWTAVPTALVTTIAALSAVALAKNDHVPSNRLVVDVTARQFAWTFTYPEYGDLTSSTLRLPLDTPVLLRLSSLDVIHSFWVKEFGQKQDALPRPRVTTVKVTPTKLSPKGGWDVICTELCGAGHSFMRSSVFVVPKQAFESWAKSHGKTVSRGGAAAGKAVFADQGCGSCHTFKPAGSSGKVGPDLDRLPQYARRAGQPLDAFVRRSIVAPNAYVEKGFPPNVMPQTFGSLPKQQLDSLVQYLTASGTKGSH